LSSDAKGAIDLWDVGTGRRIRRFARWRGLWASLTGWLTGRLSTVVGQKVIFSPDGRFALSFNVAVGQPLRLWDLATGQEVGAFGGGHLRDYREVAFLPSSSKVVSVGCDNSSEFLWVWDLRGGKQLQALRGPAQGARRLALAPDGESVLIGTS